MIGLDLCAAPGWVAVFRAEAVEACVPVVCWRGDSTGVVGLVARQYGEPRLAALLKPASMLEGFLRYEYAPHRRGLQEGEEEMRMERSEVSETFESLLRRIVQVSEGGFEQLDEPMQRRLIGLYWIRGFSLRDLRGQHLRELDANIHAKISAWLEDPDRAEGVVREAALYVLEMLRPTVKAAFEEGCERYRIRAEVPGEGAG